MSENVRKNFVSFTLKASADKFKSKLVDGVVECLSSLETEISNLLLKAEVSETLAFQKEKELLFEKLKTDIELFQQKAMEDLSAMSKEYLDDLALFLQGTKLEVKLPVEKSEIHVSSGTASQSVVNNNPFGLFISWLKTPGPRNVTEARERDSLNLGISKTCSQRSRTIPGSSSTSETFSSAVLPKTACEWTRRFPVPNKRSSFRSSDGRGSMEEGRGRTYEDDLSAVPNKRSSFWSSEGRGSMEEGGGRTEEDDLSADANWFPLTHIPEKSGVLDPGVIEMKLAAAKTTLLIAASLNVFKKLEVFYLKESSGNENLDKFIFRNYENLLVRYQITTTATAAATLEEEKIQEYQQKYNHVPMFN